jgi:uroporphyrinogen-III synthase
MHLLITRPAADGEIVKSEIEQLGCRATLEPLLRIVPIAISAASLAGAKGVIATSRNALKALEGSPALGPARSLPLYVVGPGTAALARDLGFTDIVEGPGTAAGLVPALVAAARAGTLVHLTGDALAFDLKAALAAEGVNVVPTLTYRSVAAETLSPEVVESLRNRDIDAVMHMSPRTAETWARLTAELVPPADLSAVTHLCLSAAVAESLKSQPELKKILIAACPTLEEMLALVKRLAAHSEAE